MANKKLTEVDVSTSLDSIFVNDGGKVRQINKENINNIIKGVPGKSAYEYAQDGGYTGTEEEFAQKLAVDIQLDPTLTDNTKAAPAGMVGELKSDIAELQDKNSGTTVYGFHVNSNESDPATAVTYLRDAVGMTPAKMNYDTGKFEWGSWKDAFFMPRPCMLKSNGTVSYYLNENNYALKDDGTASDISNVDFDGNAMMEWGRDNKKIWHKIVADTDDATSYSVYIADHKEDDDYVVWSFYNKDNELMDHFYTPIYSGSLDTSNKLRSLSGQAIMHSKSGTQEISYAKANGDAWNIEVWADKLLMFLLLYLMGKSLDVQKTYGRGHESDSRDGEERLDPTGALDDKGLFYGYNDSTHKVKVFGMEDQWAEQWNRCAGLMLDNGIYKYKMTEGTADGTSTVGYRTTDTNGMLDGGQSPTSNGYVNKFRVVGDTILPDSVIGGSSTYYCDYFHQDQSGVRFARLGGSSSRGAYCGFFINLYATVENADWSIGAAPSCKPLVR